MREAYFCTVFCGIETPELAALEDMQKSHNRAVPLLEAVATINSYGLEVVSGIILGLDTDTAQTAANSDRVHRPLAHPGADDQSPAGPAEDTAVGSASGSRAAQRRREPRIQCRVRPAL